MSTLTKVLIVLLTISSIFLCGIVVTYVANAEDWKGRWSDRNSEIQRARAGETKATDDYNKLQADTDALKQQLNDTITALEQKAGDLQTKLDQAEREKSRLLNNVDTWSASVKDLQVTNDKWQGLLENTQTELRKVEAERDKQETQNKEVTATLVEKMAIIAQLEGLVKELQGEKVQLQTKLVQVLRQFGKTVTPSTPSRPPGKEKAQVAPVPLPAESEKVKGIGLKGLVKQLDLKNQMAEISIGLADGVKEKMKFHVTRGDDFICDILILHVDAETAVGVLELMDVTKKQPKVGDNASTNIGS